MKRYIITEDVVSHVGAGEYKTLFKKGEIVEQVVDWGPFPWVRRVGTREKPVMVRWGQLQEISGNGKLEEASKDVFTAHNQ
ncbi:hypothetical protein D6779_03775 [Candidatus Parcubacteria bacterium]|nr:MAG: hypothetical protein D6779_03775 [Candidatus Parcubacteria bacterium]